MPITKIIKEDIENMTDIRQAEISLLSPELKQEDFASEAEYRQALLKNYQALRQKEYELTVQNECMKVYNLAKDGRSAEINENSGVWNGYRSYINAPRISASEKERRKQQVQDCAISRAPQMGAICMNGTPNAYIGPHNSCAITAASLTAQICAKMGYDGEDNLIQAKYRGNKPNLKNNLVSARGVANCDSIPDQYKQKFESITKTNPKTKRKTTHAPTLNELISNGSIGVGDAFAIKVGQETNTSTGYHALTLVAVEKDENGKIIGYTLQANNGCRFSSHKINEKNSFNNKQVYNVTNTHAWIEDKIQDETQTLENLSTAELEAKLADQKQKTLALTEDLQKTESYAATKNYCQDIADAYINKITKNADLLNQTAIPKPQNQTPIPTNDNQSNNEEIKKELKTQNTSALHTLSTQTTEFRQDHVAARINLHDNKKQLDAKNPHEMKNTKSKGRTNANSNIKPQPTTPPHSNTNSMDQECSNSSQEGNQPHKNVSEISLKNLIAAHNKIKGR